MNLLDAVPRLRAFLMGDFWLERLNFKIIAPIYAAYVALLFLGPQVIHESAWCCGSVFSETPA